jgi:hypothetical protein
MKKTWQFALHAGGARHPGSRAAGAEGRCAPTSGRDRTGDRAPPTRAQIARRRAWLTTPAARVAGASRMFRQAAPTLASLQ